MPRYGIRPSFAILAALGGSLLLSSATLAQSAAPLTRDQWLMLQHDNVVSKGAPGLEAFGIRPTPFGAVAPEWLAMHGGSRFARRRVNITAIH